MLIFQKNYLQNRAKIRMQQNPNFYILSSYHFYRQYLVCMVNIILPTKLHLKNVYYLYSACSNPINVVLVIVLSMIVGKGLDNGTA